MTRKPRGERLLSRALEALILALIGLVAFQVLSQRDPLECRAAGRPLTDAELARESLAFLRGERLETGVTPRTLPEGYDLSDVEAVLSDPGFVIDVTREGDGPGDVLKPRRPWPIRQALGARLAVSLTLPADTPDAPGLHVLHVSDPCGTVLLDWGHSSTPQVPNNPSTAAE